MNKIRLNVGAVVLVVATVTVWLGAGRVGRGGVCSP